MPRWQARSLPPAAWARTSTAAPSRAALPRLIVALAAELDADLIVAGRGGPSSHGRFHFGGNAHRIVGLAAGAVLVVKP